MSNYINCYNQNLVFSKYALVNSVIWLLPKVLVAIRRPFRQDGMPTGKLSEKHYLSRAVVWAGNTQQGKLADTARATDNDAGH